MTRDLDYGTWTSKDARFEKHCQTVGHGTRPAVKKIRGRWKCREEEA
jgi:hypothetical protein